MALFNRLTPYSNLHDINLDWIISIIKSIDPAVIKALQNLTPEFIKQINNKVNEAQIAATSAQRSASDANTAKESATASADRAAAAMAAVESSLTPTRITNVVKSEYTEAITFASIAKTGKTVIMSISGALAEHEKTTDPWTPIATIPDISIFGNEAYFTGALNGALWDFAIRNTNILCITTNAVSGLDSQYFNVTTSLAVQ